MATLEAKKAKADAKAAEEAKKTEAEAVLKKLLASGMSCLLYTSTNEQRAKDGSILKKMDLDQFAEKVRK